MTKINKKNAAVAGIIFSNDAQYVLLTKRRDIPVWVLPGGGIEPNESSETAVIRELEEETTCAITIKRKIGEYMPINNLSYPTDLYECTITNGTPQPTSETQSAKFFALNDLPPLPPPYQDWIADAIQKSPHVLKKTMNSVSYRNFFRLAFRHPFLIFRFIMSRIGMPINNTK